MFYEEKYKVQIRDTRKSTKITNKGFLGLMEDVASSHSNKVGFGIYDLPKTNLIWLLLEWKLQVFSRPQFEDIVTVKTWSRGIEKYYAYRDFEVYSEDGKILAIATSKWILVDGKSKKVTKIQNEVANSYETELNYDVFENEKLDKLKEPKSFTSTLEYKLSRRDIDLYKHMHNLYYLDLAYEALPEKVYENEDEFNNIRITYKREIKYGDEIKCMYSRQNNKNVVVIRSKDGKTLHSIIEMW
ncbi:MAG: hypothetical protein IKF83_04870 [Clostridia bacterium]|nr:hypothetical protein [Clostridia bacterium]